MPKLGASLILADKDRLDSADRLLGEKGVFTIKKLLAVVLLFALVLLP